MQYLTPYHLATYLLVIQSFFHTVFGVLFPDYPPHALVVLNSMKTVQFDFLGTSCTFNKFYLGNGLFGTVLYTLSAFLTWQLAEAKPSERETLRPIAWALFVSFVVATGLTWRFFFVAPLAFAILITGLMGWECWTTYWVDGGRKKEA
jgi:hypothetical protein